MVFLTWEQEKKPFMAELEKIFPFEYEEPRERIFTKHFLTERVCGVVIDSDYHLSGYEYPKVERFYF
jgi:hypothetical protein